MSKIADGDDNAEVLDYRQIIGIATPSPQTIPIQTIALCLGVERVRGGGYLGGRGEGYSSHCESFLLFGPSAKEWGWTMEGYYP